MEWLIIFIAAIIFVFGFVVFFGAPYLPTLSPQVAAALSLADLQKGEHLIELGCGDGKVLIAAAAAGYRVTGYELNPVLVVVSYARTWRYRKQVTVRWANFWRVRMPQADAIFVFLLPKYMGKLDKKIIQEFSKPVKLVSFAFKVPNRDVAKEQDGVLLYRYL